MMESQMKRLVFAVLVGLVPVVSGRAAETLTGVADVVFNIDATMHEFDGTVASEPVTVTLQDGKASWQVDVVATNMTTFNAKRDKEMYEMFHAKEFPHIVGTASGVALDELRNGAEIPLTLTIRDRTLAHVGIVSNVVRDPEGLSFHVGWPVSLKAYGLKAPKVLFFVVHDTVRVSADFALVPEASAE
jgi:polyisoprenoid-binding protein YceI